MDIKQGDRIFSADHKGEIQVDQVRTKGWVGRKLRKNGRPGEQVVVVYAGRVTAKRLLLPGLCGGNALMEAGR